MEAPDLASTSNGVLQEDYKGGLQTCFTGVQVVSTRSCVHTPPTADVASGGHIIIKLLTAKPNQFAFTRP